MGTFYKVAIRGTYFNQRIINILYYGQDDGSAFTAYELAVANDIGATLVEELPGTYTDPLPLLYTLDDVVVSSVDERGVTNSPFERTFPIGVTGDQDDTSDGMANVAILAFQTLPSIDGERNLKRSYVAYGPLVSTWAGSDQNLALAFSTAVAPFRAFLAAILNGGFQDYGPVRVGRTVAPDPIAVGVISSVIVRPAFRWRNSRSRRATNT